MKKVLLHPVLILMVLTISIICIFWGKIIFHPNAYLLSTGGDAFKNYYTPAWFVANDHGTHFTGMNYPYGDHVVFTDNQPVISWIINFIDNNIVSLSGYTVGIMNILLFVSLFFCVFFLYKIMRHYALPPFFAVTAAILIGLMNPQLDRFWGHFALGYSMFIPLVWYLLILIKKYNYSVRWILLLIGIIICFGFIHIYYVLLSGLFIFFHIVVLLFSKHKTRRSIISLFSAGVIPLIVVTGIINLTDPVTDRPESPYGFFRYKASFQSVFLPKHGTIQKQATEVFHLAKADPEGFAYVGITGFVFLFILLFIFIKRWLHKRSIKNSFINLPGDLGIYFCASVLMLLFSMTFPFNLGLEFLLDILSPLKQFRAPGRFVWGFYYVYLVSLSIIIYLLFKKIKKTKEILAYIFISAFAVAQFTDTYSYFSTTAKNIKKESADNPFLTSNTYFSDMFAGTKYTAKDFEAIIFLPSFFIGSEKLYIENSVGNFKYGMQAAFQTHLPLVNQMMSRTSFSQTLNNVQVVSQPLIPNNSTEGVFTLKNILLITVERELSPGEQFLVDRSTFISKKDRFSFYHLNMDAVKEKGKTFAMHKYATVKDSLHQFPYSGGWYFAEDSIDVFYRNSFDEIRSTETFMGSGSFISKGEKLLMAEIPVNISEPIWIEISFWALSTTKSMAYPFIEIEFLNEKNEILKTTSVAPTLTIDVMNGWVRAASNFEIYPTTKFIRIHCSDDSDVNFDELVVRHSAYSVFYDVVAADAFVVNNFPIGNKEFQFAK